MSTMTITNDSFNEQNAELTASFSSRIQPSFTLASSFIQTMHDDANDPQSVLSIASTPSHPAPRTRHHAASTRHSPLAPLASAVEVVAHDARDEVAAAVVAETADTVPGTRTALSTNDRFRTAVRVA